MKNTSRALLLLQAIILLIFSGDAWAEQPRLSVVRSGEVIAGDRWTGGRTIRNDGTIKGDFVFWGVNAYSTGTVEGDAIGGGQNVRNEGTVKGSLALWAQNLSSTGKVGGDAIGGGQDVQIAGDVAGNVRLWAASLNLAGNVGKNVTSGGGSVSLARTSTVEGNVRVFGYSVNLDGKVRGKTVVIGKNIVLGGEFFGDVEINNFDRRRSRSDDDGGKAKLTVLPGAVIHGTLRFRGESADIQKGAQIKDFQWMKAQAGPRERQTPGLYRYAWKFVRLLFTTAVFFLMGLLLLRLFPGFFRRTTEYLAGKPWNALGHGVIALFAGIAVAIACALLLVLSVIMSPAFGIVSTLGAIAFYAVLFLLASIPVSLWLGALIVTGRSAAYQLLAGLIVLKLGLFVLVLLGLVPVVGPVFHVLTFVARLAILLLGAGALLHALREGLSRKKTVEA